MKLFFTLLIFCSFYIVPLPLPAQPLARQIVAGALGQEISSQINKEALEQLLSQPNLPYVAEQSLKRDIRQELKKAVFTLQENDILLRFFNHDTRATAFAFEELYEGKTYVWGATADHYLFGKPAARYSSKKKPKRVSIQAQGGPGLTDIALFSIPEKMLPYLRTLPLADELPQKGEVLLSMGYFNGGFHVETNRVVKEVNSQRIITSLLRMKGAYREGACGSPLLNNRGELVGIHIGSSYNQQIGYVVPITRLRQLLHAAHNGGIAREALFFKGVKLGELNVNEYIINVETYKNGLFLNDRSTRHHEQELDYAHLEDWMYTEGADEIVITIHQFPFSAEQKDQIIHTFLITYNLRTGEIIKQQDDSLAFRL